MVNFQFSIPTRVYFGREEQKRVGELLKAYGATKVLLHYGGASAKKSGLYDQIIASLQAAQIDYIELSGVKANPRLSLVREGIKMCRQAGVDFLLAVGGGSVIDSAKAIAIGALSDIDVWEYFQVGGPKPQKALPVATVLTIPAAGSETSNSCVITNEDGWYKRGLGAELNRPRFSILNPELCYTLPANQVVNGVSDIMAHIMERYFTKEKHVELTSRMCEAALKTVIGNVRLVLADMKNYDAWAQIMWAGSLAHNDLLSTGRIGDWASHAMEHELSGMFDVAHGAGLAVIFPAWMKYVYKEDISLFAQFAVRVFNVEMDYEHPENTALAGIEALEQFFSSIGLPTRLSELGIYPHSFDALCEKVKLTPEGTFGQFKKLGKKDMRKILTIAK